MKTSQTNPNCKTPKVVLLLICLTQISLGSAQYEITKSITSNGGGLSGNDGFQVIGTIAQINVTTATSADGYQLSGGFWQVADNQDLIFRSGFE